MCRPKEKPLAISIEDGETTIRISGANLNVVDGSGETAGPPNGLGNLVLGYDEGRCYDEEGGFASACVAGEQCDFAPCDVSAKNGSHNLVVGSGHQYGSVGGFVAGEGNVVSAPTASVSGGVGNRAAGFGATVAGGSGNCRPASTRWRARAPPRSPRRSTPGTSPRRCPTRSGSDTPPPSW